MIRLQAKPLRTLQDAQSQLQTAIGVEFGTLPPYLYALFSIPPGENEKSANRIKAVALEEMVHMCLACNILNAIGGTPKITAPVYPGPLPGDIGPDGKPLTLHLLPFSPDAIQQAMNIETPIDTPHFPDAKLLKATGPAALTIGEFYNQLDAFLATLDPNDWQSGNNQIVDDQFFPGQLFPVNGYPDAHRAITIIVSEGEGARNDPLDFQDELAHYFRFTEIYKDRVLTRTSKAPGWAWGPAKLGVDWKAVYPAIPDPGSHDFSKDPPAAQAAQAACTTAYSAMIDALQQAVTGTNGALGDAVRAMFDLRMAAKQALATPLADPTKVSGPAFLYKSATTGASS